MEPAEYSTMFATEERHWWYVGLHDLFLRWARREADQLGRRLDILDAGCGTGRLAQLLQPLGSVTACDFHPLAVEAARQRGLAQVLQRDLVTDSLGAQRFDLVTCADVLYHRAIMDEKAALRNIFSALKPNGKLLLQVPAFECLRGTHDTTVHGARRYRRLQVVELLKGVGFDIDFSSYRLPLFFIPLFVRRALSRMTLLRTGETPSSDLQSSTLPGLNGVLTACVKLENFLLLSGLRIPVGTSVLVVGRKRPTA